MYVLTRKTNNQQTRRMPKADIKWRQFKINIMKNQKFFVEPAVDGTYSIVRRNEINGKLEPHMKSLTKEYAEQMAHNMNLNYSEEVVEFEKQEENTDENPKGNADVEDSVSSEDIEKEEDKPLLDEDISAERILILGNGFNKDLGLTVDYEDFFKSRQSNDYFQEYENAPIVKYIESQRFKYNQNIEVILKSYVDSLNNSSNSGIDKNAFEQLELAFSNFVREQANCFANDEVRAKMKETKAFKELKRFQDMRKNNSFESIYIYSFCYTPFINLRKCDDLPLFEQVMRAQTGDTEGNPLGYFMDIAYVHSQSESKSGNIILGLERKQIPEEYQDAYSFLIKEEHPNYFVKNKEYLLKSLKNAQEIIFFGFSFSDPDIPYVKDWLTGEYNFPEKRKVYLHLLSSDIENVLKTMRKVAGDNCRLFDAHYDMCFVDEAGENQKMTLVV